MAANITNGAVQNGLTNGHQVYSVPDETLKLFRNGILSDQRIAKDLPEGIDEAANKIRFAGSSDPSLPINWRLAEAVSSLKGLEASLVNVLLARKYNISPRDVTIDTDHATLFIMSAGMW